MRKLGRLALLLGAAVVVVVILLAGADLVGTGVAESRLSSSVSDALGMDAEVDLHPWPVTPRLLAGDLVVDVVGERPQDEPTAGEATRGGVTPGQATPGQATPGQATPAGTGAGAEETPAADDRPPIRTLDARLTGVALAGGWRSFTAETAEFTATLEPSRAPFGVSEATGSASDLSGTFGDATTHVTAGQLDVDGGTIASASATDMEMTLDHPGDGVQRVALIASAAALDAEEDVGTGRLPLEVDRLLLDVEELELEAGDDQPTRVRAGLAELEAGSLPLEGSGVRLQQLTARVPDLAVDHPEGAPELVLDADGATFRGTIDQAALDQLWPGPGRLELVEGAVRLFAGPFALDVEVQPEGRVLRLTPMLPASVRLLLGEVPSMTVAPQLPEGVSLSDVAITSGELRLAGGGDRIVLPLD